MDLLDNGDTSAAPAVEAAPQPDSPRTVWFRANQQRLEEKEHQEKRAKAEIQAKAKEYVKQFTQQRQKVIEERMKANRAEEQSTKETSRGTKDGSAWDGIVSLINFNLGAQQKDTARLRTMLFQARESNLPIKG